MTWTGWVERLAAVLRGLEATSADGAPLTADAALERWAAWTREAAQRRQALYLVGNGASAALACHFACDLGKNVPMNAQVFTDPALVTASANDHGYEQVFAGPLRARGRAGDVLVAISSSGKSPNILAACQAARELELRVVSLSAMGEANPLRRLGHLNLWVPAATYGEAESTHAALLHRWCDAVLAAA